MKGLKHQINMENFILQFRKEHDLIDELVTNAFESAKSTVIVNHKGYSIVFLNDGPSLDLDTIKNKLLTAFETGEEKSLETNRGLGFIAIYGYMKKTTVKTGNLLVTIRSWDEIKVERQKTTLDGMEIEVFLSEEAKTIYSKANVEQHLSHWFYQSSIELIFQSDSNNRVIGNKFKDKLAIKSERKYKYQNLKYIDEPIMQSNQAVQFLLKLTNIEAYRLLPIHLDLNELVENNQLDQITLVISHGSYLDATRRSLSTFGYNQVKLLLDILNHRQIKKQINREFFALNTYTKQLINDVVNQIFLDQIYRNQFISVIYKRLTNSSSLLSEIGMIDKLSEIMGLEYRIRQKLSVSYPGLDYSSISISAEDFRNWLDNLNMTSIMTIFRDIQIGFKYEDGILVGEAHLIDLDQYPWVPFSEKLLLSPLIQQDKIILGFQHLPFLTGNAPLKEQDLIQKTIKRLVIDGIYSEYSAQIDTDLSVLEIEEIQLYTRDYQGKSILFMVYPDYILQYNEMKITEELFRKYELWKNILELTLEAYTGNNLMQKQGLQPVIMLRSSGSLACRFGNYLALEYQLIQTLGDSPESIYIGLLYPAIHEIAHVFERRHNDRFSKIEGRITKQLLQQPFIDRIANLIASFLH
ncbi:MAG: hypothetical protein INQ03_11105 [Candidatus Heimdallarchaeota archaeon]|nr:hypothetical protein [Candidatus Heimdallarchaeota archaeon]